MLILSCRALHAGMKKRGEAGCCVGATYRSRPRSGSCNYDWRKAWMVIWTRSKITGSDM